MARDALEAFDRTWGRQYPSIAQAWRRAWEEVVPFFAFGPEIRRVIYTTNAVEGLNRVIRKAIKTRGSTAPGFAGTPLTAYREPMEVLEWTMMGAAGPWARTRAGSGG